jgi:hypothetical protein
VSKWQDGIQKSKTKSGDFFLTRQESISVEYFVMIICLFDNIFNERRKKRIDSFRVSVVINDLRERKRKIYKINQDSRVMIY